MRLFERHKVQIEHGGGGRDFYTITCSKCGVISKKNGNIPPEYVGNAYVAQGWHVGKDSTSDLCPNHARRPKPVADPEQPLVERIDKDIQRLEGSLGEFLKIEKPRNHEKVAAMLSDFHKRVFGYADGANG